MGRRSIIGERQPNWSSRKLLMCCSVIRMVNQSFLKPANEEGLKNLLRLNSWRHFRFWYFRVHPGTSRAILIKKLKVYYFLFFAKFGHVRTDKNSDFIRFLKLHLE